MALVNRSAYVDLMSNTLVDVAISPKVATVGTLLTHVRRGDMVAVHSLRRGAAEAIELIAHGETIIEPEDHVILFVVDKGRIREVEQLFQVDVTFI